MAFDLSASSGAAALAVAAMSLAPSSSLIDSTKSLSVAGGVEGATPSSDDQASSSSSISLSSLDSSSSSSINNNNNTPPSMLAEDSDYLSNSSSSYAPSTSTSRSPSSTATSSATSSIASSPACSPNFAIDRALPIHPNQEQEFYLDQRQERQQGGIQQQHTILKPQPTRRKANKTRLRATAVQRYAADIVRKEAKALLDLASRLDAGGDLGGAEEVEEEEGEDEGRDSQVNSDHQGYQDKEQHEDIASLSTATLFQAVNAINSMDKHGKLVLTGVGKSGLLARKAVATFNSLGIQSVFMHPVEALHGDVGIVSPYGLDTIIMVSYSGRTKELLSLIHLLRHKGCHRIISITKPESALALSSDITLDASVDGDEEVDEAVPAPTSSVITALAILDSLALSLLRTSTGWDADGTARRQVFAANHPGGSLGQTLVHSI